MPWDPFVGQIVLFPFNFAPAGFARCEGQLLAIASNTPLFSLLGTTYGGNGMTTFGLPDLRGRLPVHAGWGPGLSEYVPGEMGGTESVTLLLTEIPSHSHPVSEDGVIGRSVTSASDRGTPVGNALAPVAAGRLPYSNGSANANMSSSAITLGGNLTVNPQGNGAAHENRQPYLALCFCIALQGVFPVSE